MRTALKIVAFVSMIMALSQGKPAFAVEWQVDSPVLKGQNSIAPVEPQTVQKSVPPQKKTPSAAGASKRLPPANESSVKPNEPRR